MGSVGGAVRRVVDGMTSELKVYFYACYDKADKQAYSGLTIGLCAASVREDVRKNFRHPKYISIHRVPELAVAVDGDGREYIIPQKKAPQGTRADEHQDRLSAFMFHYSLTQKRGIGNGLPSLRGLRRIP